MKWEVTPLFIAHIDGNISPECVKRVPTVSMALAPKPNVEHVRISAKERACGEGSTPRKEANKGITQQRKKPAESKRTGNGSNYRGQKYNNNNNI